MTISIHIPFYNPHPNKKEGRGQKTRFDYLLKSIFYLKTLPIKSDIFVHTHNNYLDNKKIEAKVITHNLNEIDLRKGYLTWKVRSVMQEQANYYNYFLYIEHDIKFNKENFEYWLKYKDLLNSKKLNLGFIVYEKDQHGTKYAVHIMKKFYKYAQVDKTKYFINDIDNYCCFWIYDQKNFKHFIKSKWWNFKKKLTNYRHYYGVTERSALGMHAFNIGYYKATVIPKVNQTLDKGCYVEHLTNNYFYKFYQQKVKVYNDKDYGVVNVCKYKLEDLLVSEDSYIKVNKINITNNFIMKLSWKFRIIKKIMKSIKKKYEKLFRK